MVCKNFSSSRNNTKVPIISVLLTTYKYLKTEGEGLVVLNYTIVSGLFAFTTPVPMAITMLLEMKVPARREPIIMSFALFSNFSEKRFG